MPAHCRQALPVVTTRARLSNAGLCPAFLPSGPRITNRRAALSVACAAVLHSARSALLRVIPPLLSVRLWHAARVTSHTQNIFLVGPMGAGKSAVGRQLARQLKMAFIDSDDVIEQRTGVDIAFIFEKEGDEGFRARESRVIDELSQRRGIVLATGGGAIMRDENRRNLASRGRVVYLQTSVDQQWARTRKGRHRPLLLQEDPRGVLAALMEQREPLYRSIADHIVDTDGRKVMSVANEIVELVVGA